MVVIENLFGYSTVFYGHMKHVRALPPLTAKIVLVTISKMSRPDCDVPWRIIDPQSDQGNVHVNHIILTIRM